MADSKSFSQLVDVGEFTSEDLFAVSHKTAEDSWGSRKASLAALALAVVNSLQYENLQTITKTPVGAINELYISMPKVVTDTVDLTFTNGVATYQTDLSQYIAQGTIASVVVNGIGNTDSFVASITEAVPAAYKLSIRAVGASTLSASRRVHIMFII